MRLLAMITLHYKRIQQSDELVLPCLLEYAGAVVREAMVIGLLVIVTN